jgi:phage terminase large subunit-like protein
LKELKILRDLLKSTPPEKLGELLTEDQLKLLAEIPQLEAENKILFYEPHVKQDLFHRNSCPFRLFHGANRSGKTMAGATEAVWYAMGTHPYKKIETPNEGWVVSESYKVQEEASQKLIQSFLPKEAIKNIIRIKGGIYDSIELHNGSKISFKSSDAGVRAFAGAAKRWIWFDEEPDQPIYSECTARIGAGMDLDIWLTMTPIFEEKGSGKKSGMSWTYRDLYMKRDDKRIFCIGVGLKDNPYISPLQLKEQKKKWPVDSAEYDIRINGNFRLLSGSMIYDGQALEKYLLKTQDPGFRGFFSSLGPNPSLSPSENGILRIWENPHQGNYYIGADVGLGIGGDPSCAQVLDKDMNLVAQIHGQIPPDEFGPMCEALAKHYNNAWLAIEANSFGIAALDKVKRSYSRLYFEHRTDKRTDQRTKRVGWWTTSKSKAFLVADLGKAIREQEMKIPDKQTIEELTTYVRGESGDCNAEIGCHDDRVVALGIAIQCRKRHFNWGKTHGIEHKSRVNSVTGY